MGLSVYHIIARQAMFLESLRTKLIVLWIAFAALIVTATNVIAFRTALDAQFQQLRQTLLAIASTAALSIDVQAHQQIPPAKSSVDLPAYHALVQQLRSIRNANPSILYVYTMIPSEASGWWSYIGDAEEHRASLPGDSTDVTRYPAMMAGLRGPSADPSLTIDEEWGVLLSGYAPLRTADGDAVGIIGIDMSGEQVARTQEALRRWHVAVLLIGLTTVVILGWLLAHWISRPLRLLMTGTQRLSEGDLTHRVPVHSYDEVGRLARAFNHMADELAASHLQLREHVLSTIESLSMAIEAKDRYTRGHSERVHHYAVKIARAMRATEDQVEVLQKYARLHDVGKIGVREDILMKPSTLTPEEFEAIKRHPDAGYKILAPLKLPEEALQIVRYHHERLDGRGYPTGLHGDQIPLLVAIVSAADAFDAMTAHRPYRAQPMAFLKAIEELQRCVGTQFRAEVVETLVTVLREEGKLPRWQA